MTSPSIEPKQLNQRLAKRLLAYATMAGAGIAGLASNAAAKIIYTPTHNDIHGHYPIDLNHDGINDFRIYSYGFSGIGNLDAIPVSPTNKVAKDTGQGCFRGYSAAALQQGAVIGAGRDFAARATCMAEYNSGAYGPWVGQTDRYLGFEFYIDGQKHYGWARLSMNGFFCPGCDLRIFGYAYETIPNKAIIAGDQGNDEGNDEDNTAESSVKPATLGALALGAPGQQLWRKPEADTTSTSNSVEDKP
jgi:hypothetical protein